MKIRLAVQSGGRADRTIPIGDDEFVIGRDLACHLRIDHERVDHRHCRIRRAGVDRVLVEDLDTIYGTLVNDHLIRLVEARDGDRLRVGPATLVLQIAGAGAGREARGAGRRGAVDLLDSNHEAATVESARQLLSRMTGKRDLDAPRKALQVAEDGGITVASAVGEWIVDEADVRRFAAELRALVSSGATRLVLNLGTVGGLSGPAVRVMAEVRDRCRSSGGLLKLCEVRPPAMQLIAFLGQDGQFEIAPDARAAVAGAWPGAAPRNALLETADAVPRPAPASAPERIRLIVLLGKARGKAVEIEPPFLIGRDPSCQLRPNNPVVSRLHTAIERREGRVLVRDLGGKNGTLLNGRPLLGAESEVAHGDRLQVGPLLFAFALGDHEVDLATPGPGDSAVPWLIGDEGGPSPSPTLILPAISPPAPSPIEPIPAPAAPAAGEAPAQAAPVSLAHVVLGETLLLTILPSDLNDEAEVAPVRYELFDLLDQPALPRKMVINLNRVKYLSGRAVGVLLAHYQRLTRAGGALRLCDVHPNVAAILDRMRVPMLIDIYPSAEEALREAWE